MQTISDRLRYIQEAVGADFIFTRQTLEYFTLQVLWEGLSEGDLFHKDFKLADIHNCSLDFEEVFISEAKAHYNNQTFLRHTNF